MDPWLSLDKPLRLPWETGFLNELNETKPETTANLLLDEPDASDAVPAVVEAEAVVREGDEEVLDASEQERADLIKVFEGWVKTSVVDSDLKKQLESAVGTAAECHVVSDALLERSTGTLRVRFSALRGLADASGMNPLDCGENVLYNEFCKLRDNGAAISRAAGQLQACRLAAVVAGSYFEFASSCWGCLRSSRRNRLEAEGRTHP